MVSGDERIRPNQEEGMEETPSLLGEVLVTATFAPNRAINSAIRRISFGPLNDEADALLGQTESDPLHREVAKPIMVTSVGRLIVPRRVFVGEWGRVIVGIPLFNVKDVPAGTPKIDRQNAFVATTMHSHSADVGPSGTDIIPVLYGEDDAWAHTAAITISDSTKDIIFRGKNTPTN